MAYRILYCPNCNSVFSTENDFEEMCPDCNVPLLETNVSVDEWRKKSDEEKERLKKAWSKKDFSSGTGSDEIEKPASPAVAPDRNDSLYYLRAIEKNTRETANWVKFWSILSLVSAGIVLIVLLVRCS